MSEPTEYYRTLSPKERSVHLIGQIFWIPAYLSMRDYHVVRVVGWDRSTPIENARFRIEKVNLGELNKDQNLYQHMPIPELKIKSDEELIIKKVKRRPGLLIVREGTNPHREARFSLGQGKSPHPDSHVFAPIISLRKEDNLGKDYPDEFIDHVKVGDFPEFIYLPPTGKVLKNESMALLSHLQSHSQAFVEETDQCMDPLTLGVVLDEFWKDLQGQILA